MRPVSSYLSFEESPNPQLPHWICSGANRSRWLCNETSMRKFMQKTKQNTNKLELCHGKVVISHENAVIRVAWVSAVTESRCVASSRFQECYSPFVNGSFFEHEGKPLCEAHYHQSRGSVCQACQQPILGRCVTAMGAKFHPHHLVCHFCLKPLSKGCFKEQENKPYCHPCFIKLFGWGPSRSSPACPEKKP